MKKLRMQIVFLFCQILIYFLVMLDDVFCIWNMYIYTLKNAKYNFKHKHQLYFELIKIYILTVIS